MAAGLVVGLLFPRINEPERFIRIKMEAFRFWLDYPALLKRGDALHDLSLRTWL